MKRVLVLVLTCVVLSSSIAASQTRKRAPSRRTAPVSASYAEKAQAEVRAGRERISTQIKALTQFLYLFGGISKGIETAEQVNRHREESSLAISADQLERNKAKVRASIASLRVGLDQLESSFRSNPALQSYYPNLSGAARIGQLAESQAAASNFDQAGRSLITAVNKLADALVALR